MMITSAHNSIVKHILSLRESKDRRSSNSILIDGIREIERALHGGVKIKQLVCCAALLKARSRNDVIRQAQSLNIEIIDVDERVFGKIAFGERAQGLLAVAEMPHRRLDQLQLSKVPLIVVLESVEKPGNLGAILRSCDGAGVDAVLVCDPKTDIYNPNVIRASTGIVFSLPVVADTSTHVLAFLKEQGIATFAAAPRAEKVYTQLNFKKPTAFILGAEDKGLSPTWLNQANALIKVPMQGTADSLNVSVTCALLVYEALRQRASGGTSV